MKPRLRSWSRLLLLVLMALALAGCNSSMSDLRQYVAKIKARKVTHIKPVPKIKPYKPFTYVAGGRRDPFMPQAAPSSPQQGPVSDKGIHPDLNRNKEPLESYPLDALQMVGTIDFKGHTYAMIKAPDGVIHRVTFGNHMGQHYGKVVKITDNEIDLVEIIPDGFGGWKRRAASLHLAQ